MSERNGFIGACAYLLNFSVWERTDLRVKAICATVLIWKSLSNCRSKVYDRIIKKQEYFVHTRLF